VHFHITLTSENTYEKDLSFGVVFIPNAVFVIGDRKVLIPNRGTPKYEGGFIKIFFKEYPEKLPDGSDKKAIIYIENVGHGTKEDLKNLKMDLEEFGFA